MDVIFVLTIRGTVTDAFTGSPVIGANVKKALVDFNDADTVLFIFPLYTDCMPGIVKEFFETLHFADNISSKKIGYIVQSGFPESIRVIRVPIIVR